MNRRETEAMLDRRLFFLNETNWNAFMKRLDQPPNANAKLMALLSRIPVWRGVDPASED